MTTPKMYAFSAEQLAPVLREAFRQGYMSGVWDCSWPSAQGELINDLISVAWDKATCRIDLLNHSKGVYDHETR